MNQQEFTKEAIRLVKTYGDKAYPEERMTILWTRFQFYPIDLFSQVISEVIAEHNHAPNLSKFLECANVVKSRNKTVRVDPFDFQRKRIAEKTLEQTVCTQCSSYGVIIAIQKMDPWNKEHDFLCNCGAGSLAGQLPENKDLIRKDLTFENDFVNKWSSDISKTIDQNVVLRKLINKEELLPYEAEILSSFEDKAKAYLAGKEIEFAPKFVKNYEPPQSSPKDKLKSVGSAVVDLNRFRENPESFFNEGET